MADKEILSEEEIAARQAEARKLDAEGQCVILSENKKKLTADAEKLEEEIVAKKQLIEDIDQEILKHKSDALESLNSREKEREALSNIITAKENASQDLEDFKIQSEKEKNESKIRVNNLILSLEDSKAQIEKDIRGLLKDKEDVIEKIESEKVTLKNIQTQIEIQTAKEINLTESITSLVSEKYNLESNIGALKNEVSDLKISIEKAKLEADTVNSTIENKKAESETLSVTIAKKTEEYKLIESQAFVILKGKEDLAKREAFIRSQFERAGVQWQE